VLLLSQLQPNHDPIHSSRPAAPCKPTCASDIVSKCVSIITPQRWHVSKPRQCQCPSQTPCCCLASRAAQATTSGRWHRPYQLQDWIFHSCRDCTLGRCCGHNPAPVNGPCCRSTTHMAEVLPSSSRELLRESPQYRKTDQLRCPVCGHEGAAVG
jgi:hypothetical protein